MRSKVPDLSRDSVLVKGRFSVSEEGATTSAETATRDAFRRLCLGCSDVAIHKQMMRR